MGAEGDLEAALLALTVDRGATILGMELLGLKRPGMGSGREPLAGA